VELEGLEPAEQPPELSGLDLPWFNFGDTGGREGRSEQYLEDLVTMLESDLTPAQVLAAMHTNANSRSYLSKHGPRWEKLALSELGKAMSRARIVSADDFDIDDGQPVRVDPGDPFAALSQFAVTADEAAAFVDPEWVYENLLIEAMVTVLAGAPGSGKTTIATTIAGEIVARGYKVLYVLADVGSTALKHYYELSRAGGWQLLAPDIKPGQSMRSVVKTLVQVNKQASDMHGNVLIFDTLKKMTDVIDKRQVKQLLHLMRSLTAKGATILLVAHTNKYLLDGEPIFEGTGDVMSDTDNLIYLMGDRDAAGVLTTSTKPSDKVRGAFEAVSWSIDTDRSVRRLQQPVNVAALAAVRRQMREDLADLEVLVAFLDEAGEATQTELRAAGHAANLSRPRVEKLLDRYATGGFARSFALWDMERRPGDNNARVYRLVDGWQECLNEAN
jgi:hypothetical protein